MATLNEIKSAVVSNLNPSINGATVTGVWIDEALEIKNQYKKSYKKLPKKLKNRIKKYPENIFQFTKSDVEKAKSEKIDLKYFLLRDEAVKVNSSDIEEYDQAQVIKYIMQHQHQSTPQPQKIYWSNTSAGDTWTTGSSSYPMYTYDAGTGNVNVVGPFETQTASDVVAERKAIQEVAKNGG